MSDHSPTLGYDPYDVEQQWERSSERPIGGKVWNRRRVFSHPLPEGVKANVWHVVLWDRDDGPTHYVQTIDCADLETACRWYDLSISMGFAPVLVERHTTHFVI